jgi:RimJ/RimL family protein N-acetyltransferase
MSEEHFSPAQFFTAPGHRAAEIGADELPLLQRFFELNPEYFVSVNGAVAGPGEAHEEVHGQLPAGWSFTKKWVVGIVSDSGSLVAMLSVVSDLLAKGVWHIGLFIVASELWGTGTSKSLLCQLEKWAVAGGAEWLRLGVVEGNSRAERFWERAGFAEVRKREGLAMGTKVNTVRVMAKALAGGSLTEYLTLMERDNPQAP